MDTENTQNTNQSDSYQQKQGIHSSTPSLKEPIVLEDTSLKEVKKLEFKRNNITITGIEEGKNVTMTCKRGGIIDENNKQVVENQVNANQEIVIQLSLNHNHLSELDLITVQKYLKKQSMCLQHYLSSGGEADVYDGFIINKSGLKEEKAFRIIKSQSQEQSEQVIEEYQKISAIKLTKFLIQYDALIQVGDIFIFIMEKCSSTLKCLLLNKQKMSNDEFLFLFYDLLQIIIELRVYNIIHSDLKPSNILINKNNELCLCDFGMALKLRQRGKSFEKIKGFTPKYCSPEHNSGDISYSSDLYSFGIIIIEMAECLSDKPFEDKIRQFVTDNLLQDAAEKRLNLTAFIPAFFMHIQSHLTHNFMQNYSNKIKGDNEVHSESKMLDVKIYLNINVSQLLANVMMKYILLGKQALIYYRSLNDFQFEYCSHISIAKALLMLVTTSINDNLSLSQKRQYINQVLQSIQNDKQTKDILKQKGVYLGEDQQEKEDTSKIYHITSNFVINAHYESGQIFLNELNYDEAIKTYESTLVLCLEHDRQNHMRNSKIYVAIADCQIKLKQQDEAREFYQRSIEELKQLKTNKVEIVTPLYKLSNIYAKQKKCEEELQCHELIATTWLQSQDENSVAGRINWSNRLLRDVHYSFYFLKKYFEFFQSIFELMRKSDQIDPYFTSSESKDLQYLGIAINRMTKEENLKALHLIINDKTNDFPKKVALYEFANYYFYKEDYEPMFLALQNGDFDNDIYQMSLEKRVLQKMMLFEYYYYKQMFDEAVKYLQEFIDLFDQINFELTEELLTASISIIPYLFEFNLHHEANKFLKKSSLGIQQSNQILSIFKSYQGRIEQLQKREEEKQQKKEQ